MRKITYYSNEKYSDEGLIRKKGTLDHIFAYGDMEQQDFLCKYIVGIQISEYENWSYIFYSPSGFFFQPFGDYNKVSSLHDVLQRHMLEAYMCTYSELLDFLKKENIIQQWLEYKIING